jgi:PhnB protein
MHATLMPYLCVRDAFRALEFYRDAFGAEEIMRLVDPSDGRIGHAEIRIGDATLSLADEYPAYGAVSPQHLGGTPVSLSLVVADADAAMARAEAAGAIVERPVADQFYGDRAGWLRDPFGHRWQLRTPKEDVSPAEMQQRWDAMAKK